MHPHSLSTVFTYTPYQNQTQLFILCCSYSSNYCTYSPHPCHTTHLLANLLKLLPAISPFHGRAFTFPPQLYSLNKKKVASATAGNFRCLPSLLKLLPQFCLTARILTFPPRLYHKKYLNKKKSGSYLLSHHEGSIIGVRELDFRVRDGNGYCLSTMATRHL